MEPPAMSSRDILSGLEGAPECLIEKIIQQYPHLPERRHTEETGRQAALRARTAPHR